MTLLPFAECVKDNSELQTHRARKVLSEASQVVECTQRRWGSSQCSFVINALCKRYLPQVGNRWEMQLSYRNGNQAAHARELSFHLQKRKDSKCSTHAQLHLPVPGRAVYVPPSSRAKQDGVQVAASRPSPNAQLCGTHQTHQPCYSTQVFVNCIADKPVPLSRPLSSCHLLFLFCSAASPLLRGED